MVLRAGTCLAGASLLLAACDPTYTMYLHARVTESGAPARGVWVLSLTDGARDTRSGKTDNRGRAELTVAAFLDNPIGHPVVLARSGRLVFVALPGRDLIAQKRGFFGGYEWDATLDVALGTPPASLPLKCSGAHCELVNAVSYGQGCELTLVTLTEARVEASYLPSDARQAYGTFDVPVAPPDTRYVLLQTCVDASARYVASVSDPLSPPPAP